MPCLRTTIGVPTTAVALEAYDISVAEAKWGFTPRTGVRGRRLCLRWGRWQGRVTHPPSTKVEVGGPRTSLNREVLGFRTSLNREVLGCAEVR